VREENRDRFGNAVVQVAYDVVGRVALEDGTLRATDG